MTGGGRRAPYRRASACVALRPRRPRSRAVTAPAWSAGALAHMACAGVTARREVTCAGAAARCVFASCQIARSSRRSSSGCWRGRGFRPPCVRRRRDHPRAVHHGSSGVCPRLRAQRHAGVLCALQDRDRSAAANHGRCPASANARQRHATPPRVEPHARHAALGGVAGPAPAPRSDHYAPGHSSPVSLLAPSQPAQPSQPSWLSAQARKLGSHRTRRSLARTSSAGSDAQPVQCSRCCFRDSASGPISAHETRRLPGSPACRLGQPDCLSGVQSGSSTTAHSARRTHPVPTLTLTRTQANGEWQAEILRERRPPPTRRRRADALAPREGRARRVRCLAPYLSDAPDLG